MQATLDQAQLPWLELVYEDDIETSPLQGYQRVCAFLGLDPVQPMLRHRKINHGSVSDLIANIAEVRERLAPTRFAWMLDA